MHRVAPSLTRTSLQDRVSLDIYRPTSAPTPPTPAQADALADFAHVLSAGGSEATVVPEIQRVKFGKNMWNAVLGASAALARESLRAFFRPPECEPGYDPASVDSQSEAVSEGGERSEPQTESERRTADVPRAAPALVTEARGDVNESSTTEGIGGSD